VNAPDRDRALDQLLRQPDLHGSRGRGDGCPDAETLAAWMDGGLDARSAALTESHMSGCTRCQALVATMARAEAAEPIGTASGASAPPAWWRVNLRWLAPLAAGATAAVLWMVVPDQPTPAPVIQESQAPAALPPRPQEAPTPPQAADAGGFVPPAQPDPPKREKERADLELKRREQNTAGQSLPKLEETVTVTGASPTVETARSAAAPAPPAPLPVEPVARDATRPAAPAAELAARFAAPVEIPTPDAAIRWRIAGAALERTTDSGQTWVGVETGDPASIVAGAAPTTTVVWLVGRGGAVLLTTDARTWRRIAAPSSADLVAVSATDDLNAVVRTADGQAFRTADGGETWIAEPF
jgi:hypothetical protein